jgi:signal transduction histidine kinase
MNDVTGDYPDSSERHWLAYELHDGLLQWIVSSRMNVEDALKKIAGQSELAETLDVQLKQTQRFLEEAIKEGRMLIQFLEQSPNYESVSIEEQLMHFLELKQFEVDAHEQELKFRNSVANHWPPLRPEKAWNLLRMIEQAVNNAMQHAGPCHIEVQSRLNENRLEVTIRDDGHGFDLNSARAMQDHFGIPGMEHRAKLISATLEIRSAAGEGTLVLISVPLAA